MLYVKSCFRCPTELALTIIQVLSEVKDPKRTLRIALPLAMAIMTVLYLLANVAYVRIHLVWMDGTPLTVISLPPSPKRTLFPPMSRLQPRYSKTSLANRQAPGPSRVSLPCRLWDICWELLLRSVSASQPVSQSVLFSETNIYKPASSKNWPKMAFSPFPTSSWRTGRFGHPSTPSCST